MPKSVGSEQPVPTPYLEARGVEWPVVLATLYLPRALLGCYLLLAAYGVRPALYPLQELGFEWQSVPGPRMGRPPNGL